MGSYASSSIETHLFFARIMKEHALFLEAGFPCKDRNWIRRAGWFRQQFEHLLREAVRLGDGRIGCSVLKSAELVTCFTLPAEEKTQQLSGIPIDREITVLQQRLRSGCCRKESVEQNCLIRRLNQRAVRLLDGLIAFKESILKEVCECRLFTTNYPLLIKHIIREAKLYRAVIQNLMQDRQCSIQNIWETEDFWNQIMMEHALFIRGLLDPCEAKLIAAADKFAAEYKELLELAKHQECRAMDRMAKCAECREPDEIGRKSLTETLKYQEFKAEGTEGILNCRIQSILLPLLADHVLREANHYIRILECGCSGKA